MLQPLQRLLLFAGSTSTIPAGVAATAHQLLPRCWASTQAQPQQNNQQKQQQQKQKQQADASLLADLTPEQQQHIKVLQFLVHRPLDTARNAAMLTALTASYRDLYVVMDLMHKKDILGVPYPLLDEPPATSTSSTSGSSGQQKKQQQEQEQQQQQQLTNRTQMFYPIRDFTKLPDKLPPHGGWLRNHLSDRFMTRITAFAQLLPNHLEVSYQTGSQICLWPPMEAFFPALFNIENAIRYLQPSFKRKRSKRPSNVSRVRCKLGWQRRKPYHKQPGMV